MYLLLNIIVIQFGPKIFFFELLKYEFDFYY
ncbi:uncharacterized protein METZ01_LOCUS123700 [marine metagenome]|uniref:Uncharacterized protein n=1 Tax=marine metagenome TaxID=408172 RepID=A0A381Y165_9ZZZZ